MSNVGTWQAQSNVEPISTATIGGIANIANYAVLDGCAPTYSAANLNVTVGAGSILYGGTFTAVAGASVALVADPTNPRWSWVGINSSGTPALVSGTAAATPSVPDVGNMVPITLVYVQAALTIADNATYKLDKRVLYPSSTSIGTLLDFRNYRRRVGEWSAAGPVSGAYGVGFATVGSFDTITNITGEPIVQMAATGGSRILGAASGTAFLSPSHSPRLIARVQMPAASANVTHWNLGFFDTGGPTATGAYLRIVTTGNVFFVTRQGGSETATDLGALSRTTILGFEIETSDAGVTWVCRNQVGTALATHTTNVPTAATGLNYGYDCAIAGAGVTHGASYLCVEGTFS